MSTFLIFIYTQQEALLKFLQETDAVYCIPQNNTEMVTSSKALFLDMMYQGWSMCKLSWVWMIEQPAFKN